MSFDAPITPLKRIAIVGGGISGLAAAYLLAPRHQVTLFEAAPRLGGHARTVVAGKNGDQPVDTGFIVFNYPTYPHLTAMFADLDVPVIKSDMSFGASIDNGRIEYGLRTPRSLLAQRSNAARPAFWRMVRDILRFNERAEAAALSDDVTIDDLMRDLKLGDWFQRYYLTPICGAIWSTPPEMIRSFPARTLVQFFKNHALLSHKHQHQWWTVDGGSIEYVKRLEARLAATGVDLRAGTPIAGVRRTGAGVIVKPLNGEAEAFDEVIMACHSDDALRLLEQPTAAERAALGALTYQDNRMILHCDELQMPRRRDAWSSWVYKAESTDEGSAVGVSYWMNRLQQIPESDPLFVTLNPRQPVRESHIYDEKVFRHPVFDLAAIRAQSAVQALQGENNTWFAGAYLRHGFHEDGFASAVAVAERLDSQVSLAA
ncbi:NAD(P)/FAD-dependent oxidoreductase [Pseudoruegeria sp. SHC-113]|uniref:NAD(P)/FAD-dependent oxidoreductase n=1 Tax=Pseudoruegeria sp. SHC-113 TaxID=2855439 RepID=UPI0021BA7D69|nr:FAD-dependent oxidoreductase [Pseudoruegeria sp. SHC-113]MCT8161875.1 FAD-dependent oxidoreductase [Pseudoruegeria sp. SHC-113]